MRTKKNPLIAWPEYPVPQIQLVYKTNSNFDQRPFIGDTVTAGEFLQSTWCKDTIELQEKFRVMLLSRSNQLLGIYETAVGGITSTLVDLRLVFSASLLAKATSIAIAHNHPSGNLKPSRADEIFTKKVIEAGKLLDIQVVDSIIVTKGNYFSFWEKKLIK